MRYQNPVIRGFSPDPSICRRREDYYLVCSSFEYFPGLPLYHSRDLVNWEQIGNCISFQNALSFQDAAESGGLWAPAIRYFNGFFFVTCTMEGKGNFIVHTKDIEKGNWSQPVWIPIGGIDPSLFFEEDKAYYCTNYHKEGDGDSIVLGVVDPFSGEVLVPFCPIWHGTGGGALEAPHLYHIGEWYYILAAEGGTFANHMVTIGRSRNVWGPYENCPANPILTNRADFSWQVQGSGHGDMVEDREGNWWMVHLGSRAARRTMSHLGRETFLTPFHWEKGWPVFGNGGKARLEEEGPELMFGNGRKAYLEEEGLERVFGNDRRTKLEKEGVLRHEQMKAVDFQDDFTSPDWKCWQRFLRNPRLENYRRGRGFLEMIPSKGGFSPKGSPSLLCMRQPDFDFTMQTEMEFEPLKEGDEAGLVLYHTHQFYYAFGIRKKKGKRVLFVERRAEDMCFIPVEKEIADTKVTLAVRGDALQYSFFLSADKEKSTSDCAPSDMQDSKNAAMELLCTASTRFLSSEVVGRSFTGTMLGLYAKSEEKTEAMAKFRALKVTVPHL